MVVLASLLESSNSNEERHASVAKIDKSSTTDSLGRALEYEKYLNFVSAIENSSTFNYFTVATVKDLTSGVTKEICVKGNFLSGAVHQELNIDYDREGMKEVVEYMKAKRNRYFEFRKKEALENISFYEYDPTVVGTINIDFDFPKLVADDGYPVNFSEGKMEAYAHFLFNKGYLTGENSCFGGMLELVNRPK